MPTTRYPSFSLSGMEPPLFQHALGERITNVLLEHGITLATDQVGVTPGGMLGIAFVAP